jgi:hypothetical protein
MFGPTVIWEIDYEFLYGEERKIISTTAGEPFIEGIGSFHGVFEYGVGSKKGNAQNRGFGWLLYDYCLGTDEECECQWVGIDEKEETPWFRVYPNPLTANTITLVPHKPIIQALDVKLFDITGREVFQQHFENFTKEVTIQIPTSLVSGTSPILLWAGNSRQVFLKQLLIKQ